MPTPAPSTMTRRVVPSWRSGLSTRWAMPGRGGVHADRIATPKAPTPRRKWCASLASTRQHVGGGGAVTAPAPAGDRRTRDDIVVLRGDGDEVVGERRSHDRAEELVVQGKAACIGPVVGDVARIQLGIGRI